MLSIEENLVSVSYDEEPYSKAQVIIRKAINSHALEQIEIHKIPYVETMACDALDGDVRAFIAGAHLLFMVFDPAEANGLKAAVEIATLVGEMQDMVTVAISALPTVWPAKCGALLILPGQDTTQSLLLAMGGLTAIICGEGYVGVDFMEVSAILAQQTICAVGRGTARGADRGTSAAGLAMQQVADAGCALAHATGAIVMLSAALGSLKLAEARAAMNFIRSQTDADCRLIYGTYYDKALGDEVRVTVISARMPQPVNAS